MISDEERREVARKLREVNPYRNQSYTIPYHRYIPAAEYLAELAGALGYSPKNDVSRLEFQHRLADLIEPGEPKVKCVAEVKVDGEQLEELVHDATVELTGIDRDALLALADEMEEFGNLPVKHPGIRVLHNDDFSRELGYARRIREALGVSE